MRGLFDYMCSYDVVLSFSSDSELVAAFGGNQNCLDEELKAHKAVISAWSPFFQNLLQRRIRTVEEITDRTLRTPTRIILDESIIPKKKCKSGITLKMHTHTLKFMYALSRDAGVLLKPIYRHLSKLRTSGAKRQNPGEHKHLRVKQLRQRREAKDRNQVGAVRVDQKAELALA
ncbi:hypothetical protein H8959_010980 [Pygathrix nigripes]